MTKQEKGFRIMTPEKRKEVASQGGRAAANRHKWTHEEAVIAGRKGGTTPKRLKKKTMLSEPKPWHCFESNEPFDGTVE